MAGEQRSNHRYLARIPIGNNSYRYIYTSAELAAYKKGKGQPSHSVKRKPKPKLKGVKLPQGHMATATAGRIIKTKPANMSDADWEELQRMWKATPKPAAQQSSPKPKKKKKGKAKLMFNSKLVNVFGRRP